MALSPYTKPHLPLADQIALLRRRGLEITDVARAEDSLRRIGYYRLSGYWYPLRQVMQGQKPGGGLTYVVLDNFKPSARFADVLALYVFDKKLRLLLLDAIERIEVALRVDLALHLGARDALAHRNPSYLHPNFTRRPNRAGIIPHRDWLDRLDATARRSAEEFVKHFDARYSSPLPIWIAIELWDFGLTSRLIGGLRHADQSAMAARFGLPRPDLLASWVRSIGHVRNICAHHGRLWNRAVVDEPKATRTGEIAAFDHLVADPRARGRLYGTAAALQWFMRAVNPASSWAERLNRHWQTFPTSTLLEPRASGFPAGWQNLALWS